MKRARERLVLGLRLAEGVPTGEVEDFIRAAGDSTLADDYASWRDGRVLEEASGRVHFTERGFLVSNEILCRFV
jgi:coproporphyrinogen III oxidase-like Fe-S oxidoreductase